MVSQQNKQKKRADDVIENVYFRCRKRAAEWDSRLKSREGAAELLGVSVSSVSSYELGTVKSIPVDVVVMMADLYRAPELLNHYCKIECPIGAGRDIVTERGTVEGIAVRLALALDKDDIKATTKRVLAVASDGRVSKAETVELEEVLKFLERIDKVRQEIELLTSENGHEGGNGNAST